MDSHRQNREARLHSHCLQVPSGLWPGLGLGEAIYKSRLVSQDSFQLALGATAGGQRYPLLRAVAVPMGHG